MEVRDSYKIKGEGKKVESKEIYFEPREIEIRLNAEEKDFIEGGVNESFDCDYEHIKGEELKADNIFEILARIFQKASEYNKKGWENVFVYIFSKGGEHSFRIGFRNHKHLPLTANMLIDVEEINRECSEKLSKIREILNKKEVRHE